jgi:hypothetical protein
VPSTEIASVFRPAESGIVTVWLVPGTD